MLKCPICGSDANPIYIKDFAEKKTEFADGVEIIKYKCRYCNTFMSPVELKYDFQYYHEKAEEIYGSRWRDRLVVLDEIKGYGLFDEEKHRKARDAYSASSKAYIQRTQETNNQPKCPTCSSTNIKKISTTSKVAGAAMFGLFSKTARSQFQCNNCGYKW